MDERSVDDEDDSNIHTESSTTLETFNLADNS